MIFVAAMALVVLLYFFGFKAVYFVAGGLVVFYAAAVLSACRAPATSEKRKDSIGFDSDTGR